MYLINVNSIKQCGNQILLLESHCRVYKEYKVCKEMLHCLNFHCRSNRIQCFSLLINSLNPSLDQNIQFPCKIVQPFQPKFTKSRPDWLCQWTGKSQPNATILTYWVQIFHGYYFSCRQRVKCYTINNLTPLCWG